MAKAVRSDAQVETGDLTIGLHQALDLADRQPAVPAILKQRAVRLGLKPVSLRQRCLNQLIFCLWAKEARSDGNQQESRNVGQGTRWVAK